MQGIRAEDLRSPRSSSALSIYHGPVTPPTLSPTKPRASRPSSILTTRNPGHLPRSRSIDNFSQPSPKLYRLPPSPISPPARTSSRSATHTAPDFFSDKYQGRAEERELLTSYNASADTPTCMQSLPQPAIGSQIDHMLDGQGLPHAITTPDDVAFPLKPPTLRRSTLALADVPEEDELHSVKRASIESSRSKTADANLRHTKSFPSIGRSSHRKNNSLSRKSMGRPDSVYIECSALTDLVDSPHSFGGEHSLAPWNQPQRISVEAKGIDAGWEDDIDYCYQHEAEADCDFDWDRVSTYHQPNTVGTRTTAGSNDAHRHDAALVPQQREDFGPQLKANTTQDPTAAQKVDSHRLARLQTSPPDLDFSAASSAKSSMASLRGPITPLQQFPSPKKGKISLPSWNSTDALNLDSSDGDGLWTHEDGFQKVLAWSQGPIPNHSLSNLSLVSHNNDPWAQNTRPPLNKYHSSESVMPSNSTSAVQTRRNTSSGGSLPELVCSRNYRQYAKATAEQLADRISAFSAANPIAELQGDIRQSERPATLFQKNRLPPTLQKQVSCPSSHTSNDQDDSDAPVLLRYPNSHDLSGSVASFAQRLRSSSIASSTSGSSSTRMSRVSYSLFPSVPSTRI